MASANSAHPGFSSTAFPMTHVRSHFMALADFMCRCHPMNFDAIKQSMNKLNWQKKFST